MLVLDMDEGNDDWFGMIEDDGIDFCLAWLKELLWWMAMMTEGKKP